MAEWKTDVITLEHPVPVDPEKSGPGDPKLTSIVLREPDADALEVISDLGLKEGDAPNIKQMRVIMVALSNFTDEQIGKMHRDDFMEVAARMSPLLGDTSDSGDSAQTTSPASSDQPQSSNAT